MCSPPFRMLPEEVALGTVQHHQAAIQRLQHAMAQAHIDEGRQLTVTEKQERSVQLLNTTSMQQVWTVTVFRCKLDQGHSCIGVGNTPTRTRTRPVGTHRSFWK